MKLSLNITFPTVASSAFAAPLSKRRQEEWAIDNKAWNLEEAVTQQKRGAAVELEEHTTWQWASRAKEEKRGEVEEGAIRFPTWGMEEKRTDKALWGGTNWALEEKRGIDDSLKRSEEGSLLLRPCGWGVEDKRRAGDCPPQGTSDE